MPEGANIAYSADVALLPASTRPVLKRRLITIPTTIVAALVAAAVAPLVLPLALVLDVLAAGRLSATRTALFFLAFLWSETIGLSIALWIWLRYRGDEARFIAANTKLQRSWGLFLFRAALKLFSVTTEIDGEEALDGSGGCLFLVRHASTMDTLIPLVVDPQRRVRYVLKEELLVDPCLDVVGHRLPNCFVRRGSDRSESEIQRVVNLGRDVADDEAVVIFPEGTRFTPGKRARYVERGTADELAHELQHTLSPLRAGAVALGRSTEDLDVVVIAHTGIEHAASLADLLGGGLTGANLRIKVWRTPASDVPRDDDRFRRWLAAQWRRVDAFVAR